VDKTDKLARLYLLRKKIMNEKQLKNKVPLDESVHGPVT
jgi:hypothetical protein